MSEIRFRLRSTIAGLLLVSGFLFGQSVPEDFGVWIGASYNHTLPDNWSTRLTAQARTNDNSRTLSRFFINASATRKFSRFFRMSAGYRFINSQRKGNTWATRHRLMLDARVSVFPKRSVLSYRSRIQGDAGGNRYYSQSNKTQRIYWRHTLKYTYRLNRKYEPYVAAEARFQLQNASSPEIDGFERLRLVAGTEIKLSKKHSLDIYGLMNEPFNRYPRARMFVLGIEYSFSN